MNGNSNNGQNGNGKGNGKGKSDELTQAGKNVATTTKNKSITPSLPTFSPPEQSVILKQSPIWSRTIIWT
jgi:HlyD family secretion protein